MGETISDMDTKTKQNDNKKNLEDKIGIPDSKVLEEMNRLDLNKKLCKEKNDRIMNRLNKTLTNHKYNKKLKLMKHFHNQKDNKNQEKIKLKILSKVLL